MCAMRMRLGKLLLLATVVTAQQSQPIKPTNSEISEPKLPVVEEKPCLAKGRVDWPIKRGSPIYSSWRDQRTQIGRLMARERVTVLSGIDITRLPDRILVTKPKSDIDLKPGDIILRYQVLGEGDANIWAKGIWHREYSLWTAIERNGSGCGAIDACDSKVIEDAIMELWVQVKTSTGLTGWVLDHKITRGVFWDSGVFGQLCAG
jgi:hypothetical protein